MIARKVRPGVLEIIDIDLTKEIESHTLIEISDKDAYLLLTTSKGFKVGDNHMTTINFENDDATDKMFKAIAEKHRKDESRNFLDVSKKYSIDDVNIPGTSVLLRDVNKKIISVAKRDTTNDKKGSINRLFVTNEVRDKFFNDARVSTRFKETKKFSIDMRDEKMYSYWDEYLTSRYVDIITQLENKKELKKQ